MTAADPMIAEDETTEVVKETLIENRYGKPSRPQVNQEEGANYSPELLSMYYSRLFPYHFLYDWLSYDPSSSTRNSSLFARREFSFTLQSEARDEIYLRYRNFNTQEELAADISKKRPIKIDIGAVFDHYPKDHKSVKISPEQRELVFDVDLTDYDKIRRCGCSGASICPKCWTLMTMAVKVMDKGLREDFGFQHIAWFYSGRRGVHAWVCDRSARTMSNEARSAVATYFEVSLGTDSNNKVALPHPLHPMLARAYTILEPMFVQHILPASGHGLLASADAWKELLQSLPPAAEKVRENLEKKWNDPKNDSTPAEKWNELKKHLAIFVGKKGSAASGGGKVPKNMTSAERISIESWHVQVVFRYTYPRLDINVSKMQNHLLKSPFCVHPKTGRVCVPIQVEKVEEFDPFAVPTLAQLMRELDEYEEAQKDSKSKVVLRDWEKTSLKQSFASFQKEFLDPMWNELRREQRAAAEEQAATTGDF